MCKKTLINRIKNASKIIPTKMSTITNKSVEKIKSTYEGIETKNIYNKTKQQLKQKTQRLQQIAKKTKQLSQNKKQELLKTTKSISNSATEVKNKIMDSNVLGEKKEAISQFASKIKQEIKQKQEAISKNADQIMKATNNYKNKIINSNINDKKNVITQYAQKMKQQAKEKKQLVSKTAEKLVKTTNQYKNKIMDSNILNQKKETISQYVNKVKQITKSNKQQVLEITDKQKQKENKPMQYQNHQTKQETHKNSIMSNFSVQNITKGLISKSEQFKKQKKQKQFSNFQYLSNKAKQFHKNSFAKMVVNQKKNFFSRILSNIYWKMILASSILIVVYQLAKNGIRQYRIYKVQMKKLQQQQKPVQIIDNQTFEKKIG